MERNPLEALNGQVLRGGFRYFPRRSCSGTASYASTSMSVLTSGHLGGIRATQLIALDLVFAGAWGLQRLAEGGRAMAVSITLLEFVTMAAYAVALGALAVALKKNGERAERY